MADGGTEEEAPRCGFFTDAMDQPCQQRVTDPSDTCHLHPPDDLEESPRCGWDRDQDAPPGKEGEFCRQRVGLDEAGSWCYQHGDERVIPNGRGAPEGNTFAEGNPGGGPPEGNVNAMKHGLHMTAERLLEAMDERQREEFKHRFLEYQQGVMNDSQAMALAAASVMRNELMLDLLDEGFTREIAPEGVPFDAFKKDDFQALQGFFREIRLGLHYEGNSAQHTGGSAGHENLDLLVNSESD